MVSFDRIGLDHGQSDLSFHRISFTRRYFTKLFLKTPGKTLKVSLLLQKSVNIAIFL